MATATDPGSAVAGRAWTEEARTVSGVQLQVFSGGRGEPLLVLHDYEYLNEWHSFHESLAERFSVIAPSHPGFGASELPTAFDSIDDLTYLYLDLLRELGSAHVVGLGIGGWIAAEAAVRCTHHVKRLVLVDAVGIRVSSDPTVRDIADTFVVGSEEILQLAWHDPELGAQRMKLPSPKLPEPELVAVLRNRQSAALFTWKPFMHNPRLRDRLSRIDVSTLVLWGESDRLVTPDYGRAFAERIPNARFHSLPAAGHYPYLERPGSFVEAVAEFLRSEE